MEKRGEEKLIIKKPFLTAAIAGIIVFVLPMLSGLFTQLRVYSNFYGILYGVLFYGASIIFSLGFFLLGKKYNSKFLRVMSILLAVFFIISFLGGQIINNSVPAMGEEVQAAIYSLGIDITDLTKLTESDKERLVEVIVPIVLPYFITFVAWIVSSMIISILFGIALMGLKKDVDLAKTAGMLEIIGGVSILLLIGILLLGAGIFVLVAAGIMEIIILFNEAKKNKEY